MELVEVSRDLNGLAKLLPEYLEYAALRAAPDFARRRAAIREKIAANPERLRQLYPAHSVPLGYEMWIGHLSWLDAVSDAAGWTASDLTADEAEGLALFRRAREKFWAEHSQCPACRSVNARGAKFCGGCGKED